MTTGLLNPALVTEAMRNQIASFPKITEAGIRNIERGEYVNLDPGQCPWVGVYKTRLTHQPKVLGHHSKSWMATLTVKLVLQATGKDGPDTENKLEELVGNVMDAVLSDLTVGGTVDMLRQMETEYSYDETESKTMDYQWAFITLTYEARTGS